MAPGGSRALYYAMPFVGDESVRPAAPRAATRFGVYVGLIGCPGKSLHRPGDRHRRLARLVVRLCPANPIPAAVSPQKIPHTSPRYVGGWSVGSFLVRDVTLRELPREPRPWGAPRISHRWIWD